MKLDSARELKMALTETVLTSLTSPLTVRALGVAARPVAETSGGPATVALGIVHKAKQNFALAVRVQQRALEHSQYVDLIREQAKGEVDVQYIGRVAKRAAALQAVPWSWQRNRPLRVGGSIGHFEITAGTLGCFVRDRHTSAVLILSNNHVLANENRARTGDTVLQPGKLDRGVDPTDAVGKLLRFVSLSKSGVNRVDCAVASIDEGIDYDVRTLTDIGKLAGPGDGFLEPQAKVGKVGRATGTTHGRVRATEMDNLVVEFDIGNLRFDNQIEIEGEGNEPFSRGGDSGSLIVDKNCRGVALLFAGSDSGGSKKQGLAYANAFHTVLEELDVDLVH